MSFDAVRRETVGWEVFQVEGHDGLRASADRGGEDVPVLGIRELETADELLEAIDHAIWDRGHHERPRARELSRREVRTLCEDVREALVEDLLRPSSAHDARSRDADEEVAQRRWIQDAGVVDDDERHPQ